MAPSKVSRSKRSKGRRCTRRRSAPKSNLSGIRVPSVRIFYADEFLNFDKDEYKGQLWHTFTTKELCGQFEFAWTEAQVEHVKIIYRSQHPSGVDGNYAMMLVDNGGTGIDTKPTWSRDYYKQVASYPGARVRRLNQNCTLSWYCSEMGDKNYFPIRDLHQVFTLIWVCDFADADITVDGEFVLNIRLKVRSGIGRYLTAQQFSVLRPLALLRQEWLLNCRKWTLPAFLTIRMFRAP